jgi:hypothetical protein
VNLQGIDFLCVTSLRSTKSEPVFSADPNADRANSTYSLVLVAVAIYAEAIYGFCLYSGNTRDLVES